MRRYVFALTISLVCLGTGCGLFDEVPSFHEEEERGECEQAADCPQRLNMAARCEANTCRYDCEAGFKDLDEGVGGCECEVQPEVCDGRDNNCDGTPDNIFKGGDIAAGASHTCATSTEGEVYCWGANADGQLGLGTRADQTHPQRIPVSEEWTASVVTAGDAHSCALDAADAAVHCWGQNAAGQLGDGSTDQRLSPVLADLPAGATDVSAGGNHSCGVVDEGIYCWGDNEIGQLGTGDTSSTALPAAVDANSAYKTVVSGASHTCALRTSGAAYCWGSNSAAQLGTGDTQSRTAPARVDTSKSFAAITAGEAFSGARTTGDETYVWGGDFGAPKRPVHPDTGEALSFSAVSASGGTFCGLTEDGTAYCTEGDGWREFTGYDFNRISVGGGHVCALTDIGRAYCWGSNSHGQLGNGSTGGDVSSPRLIECDE